MKKKQRTLTEGEWRDVFRARCKSRQGQTLTSEERALVDAAYASDHKRYVGLDGEVFDATVPFGSSARWRGK